MRQDTDAAEVAAGHLAETLNLIRQYLTQK